MYLADRGGNPKSVLTFGVLLSLRVLDMFFIKLSYVAMLQEVAHRCCLPYVSYIHEMVQDGKDMYGIEVELAPGMVQGPSTTLFFWAEPAVDPAVAYEVAALQALIVLQGIYGFVLLDYSVHALQLYRDLARHLFCIANRGAQLARLIVAAPSHDVRPLSAVAAFAQQLLDELSVLSPD